MLCRVILDAGFCLPAISCAPRPVPARDGQALARGIKYPVSSIGLSVVNPYEIIPILQS
jgi:hypothetical protein